MNEEYRRLFVDKYKVHFNKEYEPPYLLEVWADFVDTCESGYLHTIYEYWDDIYIRELIEFAVNDVFLSTFNEHIHFKEEVAKMDELFKDLVFFCDLKKRFWWENAILKYAGEEYADQIKEKYGIDIQKLV